MIEDLDLDSEKFKEILDGFFKLLKNKDIILTEREQEVFCKMLNGASNPEIARTLVISSHTAKAHVENIIRKLCAKNRTEAVVKGIFSVLYQIGFRLDKPND
jgi:DNA-binding NarL/FixJ family response regulator